VPDERVIMADCKSAAAVCQLASKGNVHNCAPGNCSIGSITAIVEIVVEVVVDVESGVGFSVVWPVPGQLVSPDGSLASKLRYPDARHAKNSGVSAIHSLTEFNSAAE
jgi:hypothetical protein